jgi:FkbM family methyltransferase
MELHQADLAAYLLQASPAERELRSLFPSSKPLTIFDIGACEGEDTIRYARLFPRSRVYAFEPLPANQQLIRTNFACYGVHNAELVPLALSDRSGEAVFHVSSGRPEDLFAGQNWNYGNKSSSLLPPANVKPMYGWIEFKQAILVQTGTLDEFCRARGIAGVDFIHMDVQGAECLVLAGAEAMLRHVTAIWLEVSEQALYRGQALRTGIERVLRKHGFALTLEVRRDVEGDQFYINLRHPRAWPHLMRRAAGRLALRLRASIAPSKPDLAQTAGSPPPPA